MIRRPVTALGPKAASAPASECLFHPSQILGCRGSVWVDVLGEHGAPASTSHSHESATLLLRGSADWQAGEGPERLEPGSGVFAARGPRPLLRCCSDAPAIALVVLAEPQAEPRSCLLPPLAAADGAAPRLASSEFLDSAGGFMSMAVQWIATAQTVGARSLVLAASTFTPGGSHQLHRHPHADEFFLVLEGAGEHLGADGPERLQCGDLAYIPAGEWHGFRTAPGVVTRAVYGYLGAGSLEQAGYQLQEVAP